MNSRSNLQKLLGILPLESPFPPKFPFGSPTHCSPTFAQDLAVFCIRPRFFVANQADCPQRDENPADGAQAECALASHQPAKPKKVFEEAQDKEASDDRAYNGNHAADSNSTPIPQNLSIEGRIAAAASITGTVPASASGR